MNLKKNTTKYSAPLYKYIQMQCDRDFEQIIITSKAFWFNMPSSGYYQLAQNENQSNRYRGPDYSQIQEEQISGHH